jgi:hypothetical protein
MFKKMGCILLGLLFLASASFSQTTTIKGNLKVTGGVFDGNGRIVGGGAPNPLTNAFVTPQQFGATGDGNTDDTAAMRAWLNYASSNQVIAFLPPATGGFYKITGELFITNGIHLSGGGGQKHASSYPESSCNIRQFTSNTSCIHLLNANDSIHIDNVYISCLIPNNYTNNNCYGIFMDGGAADSDCSLIEQVCVIGFGVGLNVESAADSLISCCSFGYNGIGLYIRGPVMNNINVESCQLSYNYGYQLWGEVDNLNIRGCDIAAETYSSSGMFISEDTSVIISGCRFEDYSTNAMLSSGPSGTNGAWGTVSMILEHTQFYNYTGTPGINRYAIAITNCERLTILSCDFDPALVEPIYYSLIDGTGTRFYAIPPITYRNFYHTPPVTYTASAVNSSSISDFIPSASITSGFLDPSLTNGFNGSILDASNTWTFVNGKLMSMALSTPMNGLVAWWKMDEVNGTVVHDSISGTNGNFMSSGGNPYPNWTNISGVNGLWFNGVGIGGNGGWVELPSSSVATLALVGSPITMSVWATPSYNPSAAPLIGGYDSGNINGYGCVIRPDGTLGIYMGAVAKYTSFSVTNWGRFLVTIAAGGTTNVVYTNGVAAITNTGCVLPTSNDSYGLGLGSDAVGVGGWFKGMMDNVRIYNRCLSAAEVGQIYKSGY